MADIPANPVATVLVGLGILAVGYLVRYRRWAVLLAGVAPFDTREPAPLFVSQAGNLVLVVGGFVVGMGVLQAAGVLSLVPDVVLGVALLAAVVLITPRLPVAVE